MKITSEQVDLAEQQIRENQKLVDYTTLEYPVEVVIDKYLNGEIFVADRKFWDTSPVL